MKKVNSIEEALDYLKEGEILTNDGTSLFRMKKGRIRISQSGSSFSLESEDFLSLYQHTPFFLYSEDNLIDEEKDEAYYRYYRK